MRWRRRRLRRNRRTDARLVAAWTSVTTYAHISRSGSVLVTSFRSGVRPDGSRWYWSDRFVSVRRGVVP